MASFSNYVHFTGLTIYDKEFTKNQIIEFRPEILPTGRSSCMYISLKSSGKKNTSFSQYRVLKKTLPCYTYVKKIHFYLHVGKISDQNSII